MEFVKAKRSRAYMKMALTGPSGSGKTWSALALATGIVGENGSIAVIDTENKSALHYAEDFDFCSVDIEPPFTVQKYIDAIALAARKGFDVLIIDSLTHAWAGEGGLLEQKEALDKQNRGGNSFTNWASITKEHERLKSALLQSPIHVITTMRSKQEYVVEQGQNGKSAPRKVGMAPIQRDGMEYEFTIVLDIDASHQATVSKDRTGIFSGGLNGLVGVLTTEHGRKIQEWREGGSVERVPTETPAQATTTPTPSRQSATPAPPSPQAESPEQAETRLAYQKFAKTARDLAFDVALDTDPSKPDRSKISALYDRFCPQGREVSNLGGMREVTAGDWQQATDTMQQRHAAHQQAQTESKAKIERERHAAASAASAAPVDTPPLRRLTPDPTPDDIAAGMDGTGDPFEEHAPPLAPMAAGY